MKKADYKFYRDKKQEIKNDSKENHHDNWAWNNGAQPIYIPKRKKKK